jgi:hypothetical protein
MFSTQLAVMMQFAIAIAIVSLPSSGAWNWDKLMLTDQPLDNA